MVKQQNDWKPTRMNSQDRSATIPNQSGMQSTETHGARAKTSTSRTSSTRSTRGQIPHIAITVSGMDCTFAEETQPLTYVTTQAWTLSPTTKRKKHDPKQPVGIGSPQNHQTRQPDPPYPKAHTIRRRKPEGKHGPHGKPTTTGGAQTSMRTRREQYSRHHRATPYARTCLLYTSPSPRD